MSILWVELGQIFILLNYILTTYMFWCSTSHHKKTDLMFKGISSSNFLLKRVLWANYLVT